MENKTLSLSIFPLDNNRWKDFEKLFGDRGACGGCWCMTWRLKSKDFERMKGNANKQAMKQLVKNNEEVGVIGYVNNEPVAWCALAPREKLIRLESSRVLKRIDNEPVWSVTCFFILKKFRRQGFSIEMLKGVIAHCKKQKIKIIEAYPIEPLDKNMPDVFAWTGIAKSFLKTGFKVAARHLGTRPVMRYYVN